MNRITGIAASPGLAMGAAVLLRVHPLVIRRALAPASVPAELARLDRALAATRAQIDAIGAQVRRRMGPDLALIFEAQRLILDERLLVPRARDLIATDRVNAEWALQRALDEVSALFAGVEDEYVHERRGDVADVVGRLRRNLQTGGGGRPDLLADLPPGAVLVADDLPASVAGQMDVGRVAALVVETGSRTHHSAILARSMGIPAVAGVAGATTAIRPGDTVLVDGSAGTVLVNPGSEVFDAAVERQRRRRRAPRPTGVAVQTRDGVRVTVEANVERHTDAAAALEAGADGIGLFRTEYLLGGRLPEELDEETQYQEYRDLLSAMAPHPVTVRTFDLDERELDDRRGGDEAARPERFLGLRGLRLSLARPEVFLGQLRALARASRHGRLRVLFPFVTTADDFRRGRDLLAAAAREVGVPVGREPGMLVGAMVEVPAAALTADRLAQDADFFSIGTNDLVQYCLAVDRGDGRQATPFDPMHPAVLRLIRYVVVAARARKRPVSVCGEMAADPAGLALLIGLGVTGLSMAPDAIPAARDVIARADSRDLRRLARRAERAAGAAEASGLAAAFLNGGPPGAAGEQTEGGAPRE